MTDELERLERALRAESPQPPEGARERALEAALEAFDAREGDRQGSERGNRRTGRAPRNGAFRWRGLKMNPSRSLIAGSASLALLLLAGGVLQWVLANSPLTDGVAVPGADSASRAKSERAGQPPVAELDSAARAIPNARQERALHRSAGPPQALAIDALEPASVFHRDQGRDRFAAFDPNPIKLAAEQPLSTFSIDVDTASYAFARASLSRGVLPQRDAVRSEELINYFPYDYPAPRDRSEPFATSVSLFPTPWNEATRLLHIGIRGYALETDQRPAANLVFLIDTSGSMNHPDKLPLLLNSFRLLLGALAPGDRVAIVTYAGSAGTVLEPTPAGERGRILAALDRLHAGGSTAGAEGIRQAYALARQSFVDDGVNRVILATDGDFNLGITDPGELESYIERERESGVFLSVLGFGMGNYNDALMQTLAQRGNGQAAYIDSLSEARKVLVDEATSTLFPIAEDVKIQVEFNPARVSEYRLIGYETRLLAREDFRNDQVDAGEVGAGHTLTAIYELTPAGSDAGLVPPLRYSSGSADPPEGKTDEFAFVKLRYKLPGGGTSLLISRPVTGADASDRLAAAPREARFAAAVAGFGQLLRGGRHTGDFGYGDVVELARGARGEDPFGYRAEFLSLVRLAESAAPLAPLAP